MWYYMNLDIKNNSTDDEIKKAYHPDKFVTIKEHIGVIVERNCQPIKLICYTNDFLRFYRNGEIDLITAHITYSLGKKDQIFTNNLG
jgi:hypothetical protein